MQVEEQCRNRVMLDLLYVHPAHPLALQVTSCYYYHFYYQCPPDKRYGWPIDFNASGGMNGFLWLSERNGWRQVVPSPVVGLPDIVNNQALNITYLNPLPHKHIPKLPRGVIMPAKEIQYSDVKPFPPLWHEDNGNRRQFARERPQVPGVMRGPQLGQAAQRLVKNTLNIRHSDSSPGYLEHMPHRDHPGNYMFHRPRPAGPAGYGRGYYDDTNYYYRHHNMPRTIPNASRLPYEMNGSRPNVMTEDRSRHREDYRDLGPSMSNLRLEGSGNRQTAPMGPRMQTSPGQMLNPQYNSGQNGRSQLPSPPIKWVNRTDTGN